MWTCPASTIHDTCKCRDRCHLGWKLLFATSWGRFQRRFDNILDSIKRHEDVIDREANAAHIVESRQARQEMKAWREQSLEMINLEEQECSAKEFHAIQSWLRVSEAEQLANFEAVAEQGDRHQGTCTWVRENPKIKSWLSRTSQTSMLWLSGSAGTGKSVILAQLIKYMRNLPEVTVLYYLCANTSPASFEYEQIIKSLLEQLLRQDADFATHVYHKFVLKKDLPKVSILEGLLQGLLMSSNEDPSRTRYIWIVLDGIDGLRDHSPNSQAHLLSFMRQLVKKTSVAGSGSAACKVLISSRPSTTMSYILRKTSTLLLTEEKTTLNAAIGTYVSQRLGKLWPRLQQLGLDDTEVKGLSNRISVSADGQSIFSLVLTS